MRKRGEGTDVRPVQKRPIMCQRKQQAIRCIHMVRESSKGALLVPKTGERDFNRGNAMPKTGERDFKRGKMSAHGRQNEKRCVTSSLSMSCGVREWCTAAATQRLVAISRTIIRRLTSAVCDRTLAALSCDGDSFVFRGKA